MIGYIKDRNTFATLDMMLDITEYDLILGSTNNNVGTALCLGELEGLENQFFIYDNRIWLIKGLSPQDGTTTITLNDISFLFSRDLIWNENSNYATIEECIADTIDNEYINLSDTMYDTPYIVVSYSTATSFIKPDTEGGLWNLKGYIAKVRRIKNVFLTYSISGNTLNIEIEAKTPTVHKIDFATDVAQMVQETYQRNSVAKITVNGTTDYYMYSDGTYGTNPSPTLPLTRVEGDWIQLNVNQNEVEADKVADTFAKNAESHIVEFWTDLETEFYDTVIIRHDGRVTSGTLSMVSISSGDNRRYCKTGDLIDTMPVAISVLADRIETVTKKVERSNPNSVNGNLVVSGDIYEGGTKLENKYLSKKTLLWTNPNIGSSFTAQTVQLNDSVDNYDYLIVSCRYQHSTDMLTNCLVFPSGSQCLISGQKDTGTAIGMRDVSFSGTSATFTKGRYQAVNGEGANNDNICVPIEIYGIK